MPVVTRWASWLNAALFYADNMPKVREIVRGFEGNGLLVTRAKEIVEDETLCASLVEIRRCYSNLATLVLKMEASSYTIKDASRDLTTLSFDTDPCNVGPYMAKRLAANDIAIINEMTRADLSPTRYNLLQHCQPTSACVERSFSMLRKILAKDRQFLSHNVYKYIILHFNSVSK